MNSNLLVLWGYPQSLKNRFITVVRFLKETAFEIVIVAREAICHHAYILYVGMETFKTAHRKAECSQLICDKLTVASEPLVAFPSRISKRKET